MKEENKSMDTQKSTYFQRIIEFIKQNKIVILTVLISGLITHFYLYSNNLICADALEKGQYCIAGKWEQTLGRWAIQFFDMARGGIVSHILIVIISLTFLAFTSIFITKLFNIKNKVISVLISLIIAVSPQIANTFLYIYCADAYSGAMLVSVLAVYFMRKGGKWNYIISTLCIFFTLAIYQGFLAVSATLIIMLVIFDTLKEEEKAKNIFKNILKYLLIGVIGTILYYIITIIILKVQGLSLASYGGANSLGLKNILALKDSIINTYENFYKYFFADSIIYNHYWKRHILNAIIFLISGISGIYIIVKNKIYKSKLKLLIIALCIIILPITINIINIISPTYSINLMLLQSALIVYIAYLRLYEILEKYKTKVVEIIRILIIITTIVLIWTFILADNALYMAREEVHRNYYTTSLDILVKAENLDGYKENMKWMFNDTIHYRSKMTKYATGFQSNNDETWNNFNGMVLNEQFYERYLGKRIDICSREEYDSIIKTEEYKNMGIYPENNSIKIINGIVVVKLSENTL